jgi:hypothetical protein
MPRYQTCEFGSPADVHLPIEVLDGQAVHAKFLQGLRPEAGHAGIVRLVRMIVMMMRSMLGATAGASQVPREKAEQGA